MNMCFVNAEYLIIVAPIKKHMWGPQGFGGSGEKGYLFSGTWGALVIILGELGSKLLVLGLREPCPKVNYKF